MYWDPFGSAHSSQIDASDSWAKILGFNFDRSLWVVDFFLSPSGGTRVEGIILLLKEKDLTGLVAAAARPW